MSTELDDLVVPLTADEIKEVGLALADAEGLSTETWQEGDPTRTLLAIDSTKLSMLTETNVAAIKGGFLGLAEDGWLSLWGEHMFEVPRRSATFASAADAIELTNSGSNTYVYDAEDVTVLNTGSGKTYKITEGFTLNPGDVLTLDCRADEIGTDSNAGIGDIDDLVTTMIGVTVTNVVALGARDDESDSDYVERLEASRGRLSPDGPSGAYAYFATTDADGEPLDVNITRIRVDGDTDDGSVTVTLASDTGAASGGDVTTAEANIVANCVPTGTVAIVQASTETTYSVTATVWVSTRAGLTAGEIEDAIEAQLIDWNKEIPIGGEEPDGYVYLDGIKAQIVRALTIPNSPASYLKKLTVASPAGDIPLANTAVAKLTAVTITVNLVAE